MLVILYFLDLSVSYTLRYDLCALLEVYIHKFKNFTLYLFLTFRLVFFRR